MSARGARHPGITITRVIVREATRSGLAELHAPAGQAWTDPITGSPETYLAGFLSLENALLFCEWRGWAPDPE